MPRHPQEPHLFALSFDGNAPLAVVRAMSFAEARDYLLKEHLGLERLTPERAFRAGQQMAAPILNARPEYADFDPDPAQGDLLDDGADIDMSRPAAAYDTRAATPTFPAADATTNEA